MNAIQRSVATERGSVSLELAVLAPALLLVIGLLVFAGRTATASLSVREAASDAARQASLAFDAGDARVQARAAALDTLAQQDLHCARTTVTIDTSAFAAPIGTPGTVTATVICLVSLSDVSVPGIPGSKTVQATRSSALDTFRERTTRGGRT
jgi:Flp pilus assembly protein TadG